MAKVIVTCEHAFAFGRDNPKAVVVAGRGPANVHVFSQGTTYIVDDKDFKDQLANGSLVPLESYSAPVERATRAPGEKKTVKKAKK